MIVHYQNAKGEEKIIKGAMHLHNIDGEMMEALLENGKMLTLLIDRIEAIMDEAIFETGRE